MNPKNIPDSAASVPPRPPATENAAPSRAAGEEHVILESVRNLVGQGKKQNFFVLVKNCIITGIFVVIPIFLSLWVAWWCYSQLTAWGVACVGHLKAFSPYMSSFWLNQAVRLLSLILMMLILFGVGFLTKIALGRRLIQLAQKTILKLPLINFIYSTCKQIGDAIWSSKGGNMFHQVVLFEYPRRGSYSIGFLTNENKERFEVTEKLGRELVSVFMPTTPNPTSGFLMYIPREECVFLDMSVSDAMRLIVSCGAVLPDSGEKAKTNEKEEEQKR